MTDRIINPVYLRDQAHRCRRLADEIADDKARTTLLALAAEYEERAGAEDRAARKPPNCGTIA
ncbi:MAG TPA: hypothetical protein VGG99_19240 [Acetobacteraceae bacterium]|jgi:hypothetical protein